MAGADEQAAEGVEELQAQSLWRIAGRRLLRKKLAVAAMVAIAIFYGAGLFAPLVAPYSFRDQDLQNNLQGPSLEHPFGTDRLGRDQLSRVIWSARTTIIVTVATMVTGSLVLAVGLGMLSGYMGGKVDTAIMRAGDVFASLPGLPMLILINATMRDSVRDWVNSLERYLSSGEPVFLLIMATLTAIVVATIGAWFFGRGGRQSSIWLALAIVSAGLMLVLWGMQAIFATEGAADYFLIFGALSMFVWVGGARVIRSQVLALRETEYILAARSMGGGTWRILTSHLLPNLSPIIIVGVSASLGAIAGSEIALTFLGVGIQQPTPSFGTLIFDAAPQTVLRTNPHLMIFPAVVVGMLIFAFNLLGDALNDVFTPKAR